MPGIITSTDKMRNSIAIPITLGINIYIGTSKLYYYLFIIRKATKKGKTKKQSNVNRK